MNTAAVTHRANIEYCYAADNDTVVINIKTAKDVQRAFIISEDPFIHELRHERYWSGVKEEMQILAELEHHILWTVRITPKYKRLKYYFELESGGETYAVCENRICPAKENDPSRMQCYKYAWLNSSDVIAPPDWVRRTVWYQIMPDRFCRASDFPENKKFRKWGDFKHPRLKDVYGGDLRGIIEKLSYIKSLGVSGIYMTPIFLSGSNHKYNTYDYSVIDPDFGTEDDLKELIDSAHSMGIRIMLDAVFNHCGDKFFAWEDVLKHGKDSPYYDWFFINSDKVRDRRFSTEDGRFYSFSFWSVMPKLNTNNPEVTRYFRDLCLHWVKDLEIDGIRFDVGDEVSHTFIRSLNDAVKAEKPDTFFLGEIWTDSLPWLGGREYDSVMNYPLPDCVNGFFKDTALTFSDFIYALNYCRTMYPEQVTSALFNFLDTHDTSRVAEISKSDDELLQKLAVIMTLPGTPCIYYGTEIAMKGLYSPYNRSTMPWDEINSGKHNEIKNKVSELIHLRNTHDSFISRDITYICHEDKPRLIHYRKDDNTEIYINAENTPCEINARGEVLYNNAYENGILKKSGTLIIKTRNRDIPPDPSALTE
ncbi:MAG: glycoside hydrolase family 13 protein [Ruminococcus sp.]|nr:glycoside hydrolase family 13 protein [Ruminococcus sp.]